MTLTMTPEIARILRAPFPAEVVGKLPRIWCGACRDARGKVCDNHRKVRCDGCRNNISNAHLHLDYIGHAETTDRLLQADPTWTWEPVAFSSEGLPVVDGFGGLWIRLTIAGVTRLGYGHAEGKKSPDAVKEAIGDAIRNAAMRFGVALDLWGATFKEDEADGAVSVDPPEETDEDRRTRAINVRDWALKPDHTGDELLDALRRLMREHPATARLPVVNEHGDDEMLSALLRRRSQDATDAAVAAEEDAEDRVDPPPPSPPAMVTDAQHRHMHALWRELGYGGDANQANRLQVTNKVLGRPQDGLLTTSKDLTHDEADQVIAALKERRNAVRRQPEGANA